MRSQYDVENINAECTINMMSEISTPNFGRNFLLIAKEYCDQKNVKNNLEQAIKINIFSVVAIEAIVNMELMNFFNGKDLEDAIRFGPKEDKRKISSVVKKWDFIMNKHKIKSRKKHFQNLSNLIDIRNELIHFKPHKNQTKKTLMPRKKKYIGPDGQYYVGFKKTGFKILREGILNELTLQKARDNYKKMNKLVFDLYTAKKTWPHPKFSNDHWGTKSPFYKYRNKFKENF